MAKRLIIAVLILAGCSPQKRLARIIKNHPGLTDSVWTKIVLKETITEIDTFTLPGDTVSVAVEVLLRDTIFKQGRVTLASSGGRVSAFTKADTFLQRDTVYFNKTIQVPARVIKRPWRAWEYFVFWLPIILLSVVIYRHARKL